MLEKVGDPTTEHSLADGIALVVATSPTKFDATIEVHIRTSCNPKHADQIVRASIVLPHGTGKTKKIAVFAEGAEAKAAKDAGADVVGGEELVEKVLKGNIDFEIAISTPDMMKKLAKAAKVLGPKGLMPSPKSGTVTEDVAKAIDELKKGKIEFKTDKQGIIHSVLGKVSFGEKKILENAEAFLSAVKDAKPSGVKGTYLQKISLCTSMGPSITLSTSSEGTEA